MFNIEVNMFYFFEIKPLKLKIQIEPNLLKMSSEFAVKPNQIETQIRRRREE